MQSDGNVRSLMQGTLVELSPGDQISVCLYFIFQNIQRSYADEPADQNAQPAGNKPGNVVSPEKPSKRPRRQAAQGRYK